MNILITNNNRQYLINFDYNILKEIQGEFDSKEIISMLQQISYNKVILDITAIKNYNNLQNIRELTTNIESDRIIIVLANEPVTISDYYISNLVNMGIYNFTVIPSEVIKLINYPRTYEEARNIKLSNINN